MILKSPNIQIIAHRGASRQAPENTLAAINKALTLDIDCVEIDVRLSKEDIPIVLHDPSASRMVGMNGLSPVTKLSLE